MQKTILVSDLRANHFYGFLAVLLLIAFITSVILSSKLPRLEFDVAEKQDPKTGLYELSVTKKNSTFENLRREDVILAVNGKSVKTRPEFYFQLMMSDEYVELTVKRQKIQFQRELSAASFATSEIPLGLRLGDTPVALACEGGEAFTPLHGVSFENLKTIVSSRPQGALVVFQRAHEIQTYTLAKNPDLARTLGLGACLAFAFLLLGVRYRPVRKGLSLAWTPKRIHRLSLSLILGCFTVLFFALSTDALVFPPLFFALFVGTTLYKAASIKFHRILINNENPSEKWKNILVFVIPVILASVGGILSLTNIGVLWGSTLSAASVSQIALLSKIAGWCYLFYVALDFFVQAVEKAALLRKNASFNVRSSEIGTTLALLFGILSLLMGESPAQSGSVFLLASVAVQVLGDFLEIFDRRYRSIELSCESSLLSTTNIRDLLSYVEQIAGQGWIATLAVTRPAPKAALSMRCSLDEHSLTGLTIDVLPSVWTDFLDVLHTEGGTIPRTETVEGEDIVQGIAEQLGIGYACDVAQAPGGALVNVALILHNELELHTGNAFSSAQCEVISQVIPDFMRLSITISYLTAESDLDHVTALPSVPQEGCKEISPQHHSEPSLLSQGESTEASIPSLALPKPLTSDITDIFVDEIVGSIAVKPIPLFSETSSNASKAEIALLQSQLRALQNQQERDYDLSEIELTELQERVLEEILAVPSPVLLIGEHGVGKHLLAMAAHKALDRSSFFVLDASEIPEAILALELFGSLENFGLLRAAAGGSLLIRSADRISESIFQDIQNVVKEMEDESQDIRIFYSIDAQTDEFSWNSVHQDVSLCPQRFLDIAQCCDADIVFLPALREQHDALAVADFFMHKRAMALEKPLSDLPEAIASLLAGYAWTGNFAELQEVIDWAVWRCEGTALSVEDFGNRLTSEHQNNDHDDQNSMMIENSEPLTSLKTLCETQQAELTELQKQLACSEAAREAALTASQMMQAVKLEVTEASYKEKLFSGTYREIERRLLLHVLEECHGDQDKVARRLNMNRDRLSNKLEKFGLNNYTP